MEKTRPSIEKTKEENIEKNSKNKEGGQKNFFLIVFGFVLVMLIVFGFFYLSSTQNNAPLEDPKQKEIAAKLLSAYETGANIEKYYIEYTDYDLTSKEKSEYKVIDDGKNKLSSKTTNEITLEGYFNNTTEIVCLKTYKGEKCAKTSKNDTSLQEAGWIYPQLVSLFIKKGAYDSVKKELELLVKYKAIVFESILEEKVGSYETYKIIYNISYQNLTVPQLKSLGIEPRLIYEAPRTVVVWMDKKTNHIVKSKTIENGKEIYLREFSKIQFENISAPLFNKTLSSSEEFLEFYRETKEENLEFQKCITDKGIDKSCLYTVAKNYQDYLLCGKLEKPEDKENCIYIVAYSSKNKTLCEKLNETNRKLCEQNIGEKIEPQIIKNCEVDSDCKIFGGSNQYCLPKNTTDLFANETSPFESCFKLVECGCVQGKCTFKKNNEYYTCYSKIEDEHFKGYINELVKNNTQATTLNESNNTNQSK
jgi:hypothetical protein